MNWIGMGGGGGGGEEETRIGHEFLSFWFKQLDEQWCQFLIRQMGRLVNPIFLLFELLLQYFSKNKI